MTETLRKLRERLDKAHAHRDFNGDEIVFVAKEDIVRISKALKKMQQWIEDHRCEAEFCPPCRDLLASLDRGE